MRIAGKEIGQDAAPFIIAGMSGNHNQSLEIIAVLAKGV